MKSVNCNSNKLTALNISGCYKITTINCYSNQIGALNTAGLTSMSILRCESNLLTSLDASDCGKLNILRCKENEISSLVLPVTTTLKYLWCQKNKITAEIPEWFDNITTFEYDRRYTNYRKDYSEDVNGKLVYKDNGVGWWYPGEPDKGYHKRD